MTTRIAVNLPVRDLAQSAGFFAALGFPSDKQLASENMEAIVVSDDIYVLLVDQSQFKMITKKEIPDTAVTSEAIMQLQVEAGDAWTSWPTKRSPPMPCPRTSRTTRASSTDEASAISMDTTGTCSASSPHGKFAPVLTNAPRLPGGINDYGSLRCINVTGRLHHRARRGRREPTR